MKFPQKAIWSNKDSDVPVVIIGVAGEFKGELYYFSESKTGIPAKELKFQSLWEKLFKKHE